MKIYLVGGAVRDKIMGVTPNDNDYVVVGASIEDMLLNGFRPIGRSFPVFIRKGSKEEYALARKEIKLGPKHTDFGFIFDGYLDIPEDGLWQFAVTSDDGAVLLLDGKLAVNGDGSHSNYTATGYIALLKGMHQFRLLYLEDYEGQNLEWAWKAPSATEFAPIPESAISH